MDKYQMMDGIIILLDRLADARGMERCSLLVEIVKRAEAIKKGMQEEDDAKAERIVLLNKQIESMRSQKPLMDGEIREGGETYTVDLEPKELEGHK